MQRVSGVSSSAISTARQGVEDRQRVHDVISYGRETDKNIVEKIEFNFDEHLTTTKRSTKRKTSDNSDHADHASVTNGESINELIASINSDLTNRIALLSEKSLVHPNAHALKSIYVKVLNLMHTSRTMQEFLKHYATFRVKRDTPTVALLPLIFLEMLDYLIVKVMADDLLDLRFDVCATSKYVTCNDIESAWISLMVRPVLYRDVCNCIRDGCIIDFNHTAPSGIDRSSSHLLYEQYFPETIRKPQLSLATNYVGKNSGTAQFVDDQVNVKVHVEGCRGDSKYYTVTTMTVSYSDTILSIKKLIECTDRIPPVSENKMMCDDEELKDEACLTDIRQHLKKNAAGVGFEFSYICDNC